jgi:RNA polymerase sigma factor (TIGR02999 family)
MSDVTRILSQIEQGDPQAAEKLLPLVYEELRKLAAVKLAQEKPGQTLQATALVHEAYVRLVGDRKQGTGDSGQQWDNRGHFFAAAAEAMRRILVESIRRKQTAKHGAKAVRIEAAGELIELPAPCDPAETLAVHELLDRLAAKYPRKAEVVKLRYFLGCSQKETAQILGITDDAVQDDWQFARVWLKRQWRQGTKE